MTTVQRPREPKNRVTIANVADWQRLRQQHDEKAGDPVHMANHLLKAAGPVAAIADKMAHGEDLPEVDERRAADLIIAAIWMVENVGIDAAAAVTNRIMELGIGPKHSELPPEEKA